MREIRSFLCDERPVLSDYVAARDLAASENCVVCLQWIVPYSGTYSEVIYGHATDDELEAYANKHYVYPI